MNDIDDWLTSLGITNTPTETQSPQASPVQSVALTTQPPSTETPPPSTSLSPSDIDEILSENGFQEPVYEEVEEVTEENEEEDENGDEERDLDAEEDEDWNALESQGVIQEYTWDVIHSDSQAVLQAVPEAQSESDIPEPTPAAVIPVTSEQVSDSVIETFNTIAESSPAPTPEPLIPPNSPTLLLNDATSRFSGTEWYNEIQKQRIILAGCGGIGSWTVLQLARMNPATLFLYDDDEVEQANMSGQLYCQDDVGKAKVDAMADMVRSYTTMHNVYAIRDKFKNDTEAGDVMICGFDNMAARRTFFTAWNNHAMSKPEEERHKCLYLDGRLSIDCLQVFCITGDNDWAMAEYADKYLFTDAEAEETQCSLKQTTYLACMIGSVIVNLFTNWTANLLSPIIPYDLPFFTEYDAQNMIFKTIK